MTEYKKGTKFQQVECSGVDIGYIIQEIQKPTNYNDAAKAMSSALGYIPGHSSTNTKPKICLLIEAQFVLFTEQQAAAFTK